MTAGRLIAALALLSGCSSFTLHKERFPPLEIGAGDAKPAAAAGDAKTDEKQSRAGDVGSTRDDIVLRMESTREPITACYARSLKGFDRLAGTIVVSVLIAADTGQFTNVRIEQDDLGDPSLNDCIVDAVGQLKLVSPSRTKITIRYPLHFTPPGARKGGAK